MEKQYKKYWLFGIIGAVCFGIGDWLLGYVDPGIVNESFSVIKAGHGADYNLLKSSCKHLCRGNFLLREIARRRIQNDTVKSGAKRCY